MGIDPPIPHRSRDKAAAAPPAVVGRIRYGSEPRGGKGFGIAGVAAVALILIIVGLWLVIRSSIDLAPKAAAPVASGHVARWDLPLQSVSIEGLFFLDDGTPTLLCHFNGPNREDIIYRLAGKHAEKLVARLAASKNAVTPAAQAAYLSAIYPRCESTLRWRYQVERREEIAAALPKIGLRFPSTLHVKLEVRAPKIDCTDSSHGRGCTGPRIAWLDGIPVMKELP